MMGSDILAMFQLENWIFFVPIFKFKAPFCTSLFIQKFNFYTVMSVSALDVGDPLAVRSLRLSISIISVNFGAQLNRQLSRPWHLVYKHLNDDTRFCNNSHTEDTVAELLYHVC